MSAWRTSITASKAVVLGREVVCDGFHRFTGNRVQTHVHMDHMSDFDRSIGIQYVWTLPATKSLLISERNATLDVRSNFVGLGNGITVEMEHGKLTLLDSGHMLGSAQVSYEHKDGYRTGYSGDFAWPLEHVIHVDELVLDSTYGSPDSVRKYSQEDAENALGETVVQRVANGPVYIYAWRGTLQRALTVIAGLTQFPIIVAEPQIRELAVYRNYGFDIPAVSVEGSAEANEAIREGRFILLRGRGSRVRMNRPAGYLITLSARMVQGNYPVLVTSPSSCDIAVTDHADFVGTLEYVHHTGAQRVVTDNARGPYGVALALAVSERLGIDAIPGGDPRGFGIHEWGV